MFLLKSPPLKSIPKLSPFIIKKNIEIIDNKPEVIKKNFLLSIKFMLGVFL